MGSAQNPDEKLLSIRLVCGVFALVCAMFFMWRLSEFSSFEPMIDQSFFTQWIKRMRLAGHVLPNMAGADGWVQTLMLDEDSLLNIYLRQVYASQQHIFTIVSVGWFYLWSFVFGFDIDGHVLTSVGTSALALFTLALIPVILDRSPVSKGVSQKAFAIGFIALLLAALNTFLTDFSATGLHNVGVLFLVIASIVTVKWINCGAFCSGKRMTLLMAVSQLLALYAFYTNVFLLPTSTFLAIVFTSNHSVRWRFLNAGLYTLFIIALMSPALLLLLISSFDLVGVVSEATFADVGAEVAISYETIIGKIGLRLERWVGFHTKLLTPGGLIIGVIGLAGIWKTGKVSLFLFIVISHLFVSGILNGFGFYQKTSGYLIPFLILGMAWVSIGAIAGFRQHLQDRTLGGTLNLLVSLSILSIVGFYIVTDAPKLSKYPHSDTLQGFVQKDTAIRTLFSEIDKILEPGDLVVPMRDYVAYEFWNYSVHAGKDVDVFRPISTMIDKMKNGELKSYISQRGLSVSKGRNIIFLVPEVKVTNGFFEDAGKVFGDAGFQVSQLPTIQHIKTWGADAYPSKLTPFSLYRLER